MQLYIKPIVGNESFKLDDLGKTTTITQIKKLIETKKEIPVVHQMLIFNQKELSNTKTLQELNIQDKATIVLCYVSGGCKCCSYCYPFYKDNTSMDGHGSGMFRMGF